MLGARWKWRPRAGLARCHLRSGLHRRDPGGQRPERGRGDLPLKAVLGTGSQPLETTPSRELIDKLLPRIRGMQQARESKYIMLHASKDKARRHSPLLLPGAERPTIMQLAGETNPGGAARRLQRDPVLGDHGAAQGPEGPAPILVLCPSKKMME